MKAGGSAHNLIIFLSLAAALLVALAAPGAVLVLKLLVPEWFFVARPEAKRHLHSAARSVAFCFLSTASPDSVALRSRSQSSPN